MKSILLTIVAGLLIPVVVVGDDWKDENGKGKFRLEENGRVEAPGWIRGRGYWNGRQWEARRYDFDRGWNGNGNWDDDWDDDDDGDRQHWSIGVSGIGVAGYVQTSPMLSPVHDLLESDYRELRRFARSSLTSFDSWLAGIPVGDVWRRHFETGLMLDSLQVETDAPPTPTERQTFARVLGIFDEAVSNADFTSMTRVHAFRASRAALRELAISPEERLVRQLSISARHLHRALAGLSTGPKWQAYLALPDEVIAAADRPVDLSRERVVERGRLQSALDRFDRVAGSPDYASIAGLPPFQTTHERLVALLQLRNPEASPLPPPPGVTTPALPERR